MSQLAKDNPEKLESLRQQWTEELISRSSSTETQRRLRGLDFKLNLERQRKNSNELGRCVRFSQMMHESFSELWSSMQQLLVNARELNALCRENSFKQEEATLGENVVLLKRKRDS
ncbi:DUF3135 domain-containing protein [Piscirickettsia litoralis]|uniref:DUF3135 domain-containing protein n=1 Tax=Piscirickettsia litoralis TaxID=1891921 RepID=UPI001F3B1742|nr:DUF3135 domain-containing protein [Piscirickettsia litoralis]